MRINLFIIFLLISSPAFAYIGPGMGGGVIAAVIGVIGAIFLALFGILYYPIKRALKKETKDNSYSLFLKCLFIFISLALVFLVWNYFYD